MKRDSERPAMEARGGASIQIKDGTMNQMGCIPGVARTIAILALAASVVTMPGPAHGQQHGGEIQKSCTFIHRCAGKCQIPGTGTGSMTACGTDSSMCTRPERCVPGPVCSGPADCGPATASTGTNPSFCVGGPDGGSVTCDPGDPVTGPAIVCRAAADC